MLEELKRLWYSVSFRFTIIIFLVFGIANYYGIKILSNLLSTSIEASQCASPSKFMAHSLNGSFSHISNTLKSATLAKSEGMGRKAILQLLNPLVEVKSIKEAYIIPFDKAHEIIKEKIRENNDFLSDSLNVEDRAPIWTDLYIKNGKHTLTGAIYLGKDELLCVDILVQAIRDYIEESKPQEDATIAIISPSKKYVYHSDSTMLMKDSQLHEYIELNENGDFNVKINYDEEVENTNENLSIKADASFFGQTIETTGWYLYCTIPKDSPFAEFSTFIQVSVVSIYSILLFVLAFIILIFARHLVKPIREMTDATQEIARGNFSVTLPKIKSHTDIRLLRDSFESMKVQLARYIEDVKLATEQKVSIERDLQIAHEIQQGLLPQTFPAFPERNDIDIYGLQLPAKKVGGDLFDFMMRENKLYFCIGDVAGKGVGAALFMSVICNLFRYSTKKSNDPAAIVSAMNNQMAQGNESSMFCTLFVGVLDMESGVLNYCNAGHNGPILVQDGECTFIKPVGDIPTGLFTDFKYKNLSLSLKAGNVLFLYSDGVTEAENKEKTLYGEETLLSVIERCKDLPSKEIAENVRYEVNSFVNFAEQSDDITILCLRYKP